MPASTAALWILCFAAVGSAAVWFVAAVKWHNDGAVLSFEPRKRVPWGLVGALPAFLMVFSALDRAIWSRATRQEIKLDEVIQNAVSQAVVYTGLSIAVGVVLVGVYRATWRDFGFPRNLAQVGSDAALGALGWLAALLPVLGIQIISVEFYQETSQNPLIKLIQEHPDWRIFLAAFVSAVIVAPLFEELIFRALLQGWLERVEDEMVGFNATERSLPKLSPVEPIGENPEGVKTVREIGTDTTLCPSRSIFGLTHGFVPIVLSSILFSLAHFGFGPDPIALFVLALFLGYLYQRTHRLMPCVILHMFFNALSLLILWLSLPSLPT